MRSREIKQTVWLNKEEKYILKLKSQSSGKNTSDFIRQLIVGCEVKEKPPIEFYEAIKQIRAIGINLNQIAKNSNAQGFVDGINLRKEIEKIDNFILEIKKEYLLPKNNEI